MVTIIDSDRTLFLPKTPGSLIGISPNFYAMYIDDCQLICLNQNCDIPIRFRTPVCQMNENRPISVESQHNFHLLPHFNSNTTEPIFTIFSHDVEQLVELLMRIFKIANIGELSMVTIIDHTFFCQKLCGD